MQVTASLLLWALFSAAQIDARPPEIGSSEVSRTDVTKQQVGDALQSSSKSQDVGSSRNEASGTGVRDFKGYQYIDQSLKTVATQLLNVSNPEELPTLQDDSKLSKIESKLNLLIRKPDNDVKETPSGLETFGSMKKSSEMNSESHSFGRPVNSKFGFFQSSHPGQAMAITEEELERELAAARTTTHKTPVTTVGGISTWILLNPPSSTSKSQIASDSQNSNKVTETKISSTTSSAKPSSTTMRVETSVKTTVATEKPSSQILPIVNSLKQTTTVNNHMEKVTTIDSNTTPRAETTESIKYKISSVIPSTIESNDNEETTKPTTKKVIRNNSGSGSTTPKSMTTITKTTAIKVSRPNPLNRSTKPPVIRKPSNKPNNTKTTVNVTSKIEKVTFRPVQIITSNKNSQSKPMFVSKLQATLQTNPNASASVTSTHDKEEVNVTDTKIRIKPTKTNVLKVQLKKPVDSQTTIEIEPIKVNAPVLTIEKVDDKKDNLQNDESVKLKDPIDVKFDFNPELTKIVESSTKVSSSSSVSSVSSSSSSSSSLSTTTKRPKSKRKKNKLRRRKPSTTSVPSTSLSPIPAENNVESVIEESTDISIQESKIVPESKVTNNNNNNTKTNNKKKQVAKPIGTQIYQFLSREVMPSVGVMSLVGLGLGLASYFLYPFGGTIARRNYEVEPNYKYNMDEYGGNYGQSEEEVLSKVFLGMNNNNNNNNNNYHNKNSKYNVGGNKNLDKNYYRYQAYDGAYTDSYTTRRNPVTDTRFSTSAVPIYRPDAPFYENHHNRDNEFKYPDLPTTPNYYERQTKPQFMNSQPSGDRKFVVGSIPKEYSYDNQRLPVVSTSTTTTTTTESIEQTDFEKEIAEKLNFVKNPVDDNFGSDSHVGSVEASALKADAPQYDDIEITPTAVVVEHGPRAMKLGKLISRRKRESVIQQIPARSEIEKAEQEEDLSNEILDIIDSAITEKPIKYIEDEVFDMKKKLSESDKDMNDGLVKDSEDKVEDTKLEEADDKNETKILTSSTLSNEYLPGINVTEKTVTFNSTTESNENDFNSTLSDSIPEKPVLEKFNFFNFVKTVAEVKLRVGLTLLKHASENFAKYIGNIQKRLNGDE